MSLLKYILHSAYYYRRQHVALFLGMAVTAAVLTGALIIGDSIRFSLNERVNTRLGNSRFVVTSGTRFTQASLGSRIAENLRTPVAPVLMLRGIAINNMNSERVNQAMIYGIDSSFGHFFADPLPRLADDEAVINQYLADKLHLNPGDELFLRVQSASLVPVNAPLAREPQPTRAIRLTVKSIANSAQGGSFNLSNNQAALYNIFVSRAMLGSRMELDDLANTFLVTDRSENLSDRNIENTIQKNWTPRDMGLIVKKRNGTGYFDLVSDRIFIDTIVQRVADSESLRYEKVITYLVNDIASNGKHTPYSFASAVSRHISGTELGEEEILINQWTADDLGISAGDSVDITYYEIGPLRRLYETSRKFRIKAVDGNDSRADSTLMPAFQGLSDAGNCRDWDAGVPIDLKRIREKDEKYWDDYRGTPKVLMSFETGRQLWQNSFGSVTTMRFNEAKPGAEELSTLLSGRIRPSDLGFLVVNIKAEGESAAENAVNFTELFLGMSFFIIAAGVLLTVLLYSLHFNRRSSETAILTALGFKSKVIARMRMSEALLVIIPGSIAGALLGILYNKALIAGINTIWHDMVRMDMITVHVSPSSFLTGIFASILIALVPVYLFTVRHHHQSVALRFKERTLRQTTPAGKNNTGNFIARVMLSLSFLLIAVSLIMGYTDMAALYLSSAALFIFGCLLLINNWIRKNKVSGNQTVPDIKRLALSNLKRNPDRSLAVIALLATGTFAVVLTGSYRKTYYGSEQDRKSGTGGYLLWAETTSPVFFDLNGRDGEERLITGDSSDLHKVRFLQFDRLEGDDASCLNLNQAQRPGILAVDPHEFDSTGAFTFVKMLNGSSEHPWRELDKPVNDSVFPAFVDQTVLQYSLKRKIGDTLNYRNETGNIIRFIIAGSLDNSVFQGHILISDRIFRRNFPSSGGTRIIMAEASPDKLQRIAEVLNQSLTDYGIDVMPAATRLALFNSVENTYLSVFMALSGLGLIIGTIGLGIVLLRNVHERRKELALLRSLGYKRQQVFMLVFAENLFLLLTGWGVGLLAAFFGILPSVLSPAFDLQWEFILLLTSAVFISGLLWIYFPIKSAIRQHIIPALRND